MVTEFTVGGKQKERLKKIRIFSSGFLVGLENAGVFALVVLECIIPLVVCGIDVVVSSVESTDSCMSHVSWCTSEK